MEDVKRKIMVDKLLIICGIMGFLIDVVAFVLVFINKIPFDFNYVIFLPVTLFFVFYGRKLLKQDKERYNM